MKNTDGLSKNGIELQPNAATERRAASLLVILAWSLSALILLFGAFMAYSTGTAEEGSVRRALLYLVYGGVGAATWWAWMMGFASVVKSLLLLRSSREDAIPDGRS